MDYLTSYYKNLSEQLQAKVNNLEQLLEYRRKEITHLDVVDVDPYRSDPPLVRGTEVTKQGNPLGKGARKNSMFSIMPGMGSIHNLGRDEEYFAREIVSNTGYPTVENNPIYASMMGKGPALEVDASQLFKDTPDRNRKGRNERGMGKKAKKKDLAIALGKLKKKNKLEEKINFLTNILNETSLETGKKYKHEYSNDPRLQMFSDEPDPKTGMSEREMAGYDRRTNAEATNDLKDIENFNKKYPYQKRFSPWEGDYGAEMHEQMPVDIHGRPIHYTFGTVDQKQREEEKAKQDKIREEERRKQEAMQQPMLA